MLMENCKALLICNTKISYRKHLQSFEVLYNIIIEYNIFSCPRFYFLLSISTVGSQLTELQLSR